jgi:hypothetical protein
MAIDLVDAHRTAEDDEPGVALECRPRVGVTAEVHVTNAESRAAKLGIERSERFVRDVLTDE